MTKGEKKKLGRPSELAECLVKAKEYLLGGYETFGDVVPSVAGLACYLGKSKSTVNKYAVDNPDFSDTLEAIKTLQESKLLNGGLTNTFNATITKLMLSNHGYSEKQEVDHHSSDGSMSPKPTKDDDNTIFALKLALLTYKQEKIEMVVVSYQNKYFDFDNDMNKN